MEQYQMPITKKNLNLLYEALSEYRKNSLRSLNAEELIAEQKRVRNEIEQAGTDQNKVFGVLFSYPDDLIRAQERAWKKDEADLDILIAKVQVLRQKLESDEDSIIVDDFLREILK